MDGSTHKKARLYAITVRYFNENGVNCRLLDLAEMVSEKAVDMVGLLRDTLKACGLDEQKMIGFTADNTNSNFGGENRAGQNNVYAIMTREVRAEIIGIGCSSHIAHNAAMFGCDKMDVDFENFVLKITAHFSGNPHRTSLFKQFCKEQEVTYRELPQKADTRWLSLGKLAKCVLKMWPAIYAYFSSTDDAHAVLERAFESPEKALKYQALTAFMSYALSQFNLLSYATQDTKLTVLELVETVDNFKSILSGQLRDKQYGTECGDLLEQL
ncbi:hypothetical protein AAVH_16619 [Aphelenchoides avenae]|nr:hypothetical protein AAVH_16619 [Aphelenchus avenae]